LDILGPAAHQHRPATTSECKQRAGCCRLDPRAFDKDIGLQPDGDTEHDAVLEAAVVARADDRWGEVPVAFVVLRPDGTATPDELLDHCRAQLAKFKVPRAITFIDALPRNPSGKVLKRELRLGNARPPDASSGGR